MQQDIEHFYRQHLDHSHYGHPSVINTTHTGRPGRPAYSIDPNFLQWAYTTHSIISISRFLGISRRSVRYAILAYGIAKPQSNPFIEEAHPNDESEESQTTI